MFIIENHLRKLLENILSFSLCLKVLLSITVDYLQLIRDPALSDLIVEDANEVKNREDTDTIDSKKIPSVDRDQQNDG